MYRRCWCGTLTLGLPLFQRRERGHEWGRVACTGVAGRPKSSNGLDLFSSTASGVDHLGMRVAGEQAYARLIDFTTTVSYRPRYFSFLCWALQKAFVAAGGREHSIEHVIDPAVWRRVLKRYDFAMAAATIAADPPAQRIAGSRKISKVLSDAGATGDLTVGEDHLRAAHGSFDTYVGSMYNLRLLIVAGGISRPSAIGTQLAAAFEGSLQSSDAAPALGSATISRADLLRIGARCGITRLSSDEVLRTREVRAERDALRAVIVNLDGFRAHEGVIRNRLHSIGFHPADFLDDLWPPLGSISSGAATLPSIGIRTDTGVSRRSSCRPRNDRVRSHWRIYQAHAYATLALEALLSLVIDRAFDLQLTLGDVLPTDRVVEAVLESMAAGGTDAAGAAFVQDGWWNDSLESVVSRLEATVAARAEAEVAEPELSQSACIASRKDPAAAAHDTCLLFLLSSSRMRALFQQDGPDAWTGESDPERLPPSVLVNVLEDALSHQRRVRSFLHDVILELVIRQHRKIALRKLAADPSRDTSELLLEAGGMIPLTGHFAGTSNPRYTNAVMALGDLGYLAPDGSVTLDGEELLAQIARPERA